jgi:RIO-like serine/threonine protein kinase
VRTYLPGEAIYRTRIEPQVWFRDALRQLRLLHARGIVHNDLAKEANWICSPDNRAGIVDFQIACCFARRGGVFRVLAREDLRHLLKHKRHYAPQLLSARQRAILAQPAWTARLWRGAFKPVYRFVTRRLLGWQERDGAAERSV